MKLNGMSVEFETKFGYYVCEVLQYVILVIGFTMPAWLWIFA